MPFQAKTMLCKFCQPIPTIARGLAHVRDIPFYESFEVLKTSASNGCLLCSWIVDNFPKYAINKIKKLEYIGGTKAQYFALMFLIDKAEAREIERQDVPLNSLDNLGMFFQAFYSHGRPPASKNRITGRRVCVDSLEAIRSVALSWISTCESTHEACQQSKERRLPSRILKVGEQGEIVVLMDSRGLEGVYTILSYCWGLGQTLKTTPLTLVDRQRGIPEGDLPLTLRHAVQVTRQLGIKYLWIDALCIIQEQDPPVDWLAESGKMLDYYRNAYITIGNLDGEASTSGFLFPREDASLELPGHADLSIRMTSNRVYWSIYNNSVLATRAWCLQERLISTRLLLFGKDQLFWECRACCEREGIVVAAENRHEGRRIEELEHEMIGVLASLGSDGMSLRDSMNIWYSIVEQYTSRSLTRATDILIAISGVATEIQRHTGHEYVHGLWKQDWGKGLAWNRRPGGQETGAPSWSWASRTGLIGFKVLQRSEDSSYNTTFEDQIEVLSTFNDDRELHVRGRCRHVDSKEILKGRVGHGKKTNIYVFWDSTEEPYGRDYVELDEHDDDLPKTMYKAINTLMRYSYTVEAKPEADLILSGYFVVSYLLLAPDEVEEGKWRRVGLGTYHQEIVPKAIGFEDLGSEAVIMEGLRPALPFDNCDFEYMCLI